MGVSLHGAAYRALGAISRRRILPSRRLYLGGIHLQHDVPCVCASVRVRVCVHSTPRAPIGPELAARRSRDAPTLVVCGGLLPLAIARSTRRRRRRAGAASRLARHGPRESYTATVATTSRARRQAVTPLPPQRAGVPEFIHPTDPTWLVENTHDSHGLHGCPEPEVAADVVAIWHGSCHR